MHIDFYSRPTFGSSDLVGPLHSVILSIAIFKVTYLNVKDTWYCRLTS